MKNWLKENWPSWVPILVGLYMVFMPNPFRERQLVGIFLLAVGLIRLAFGKRRNDVSNERK